MLIFLLTLFLIPFCSSWHTNVFNNSLAEENLYFSTPGSIIRYLSIPSGVYYINNAYLNLTYPIKTNYNINISEKDSILFFQLEETTGFKVYDNSSRRNNGTRQGDVTINKIGRVNKAYYFNGTGGNITVADNGDFNFTKSNGFTIAFWINQTQAKSNLLILQKKNVFELWGYDSAHPNKYVFDVFNNSGSRIRTIVNAITLNDWNYIVLMYNGTHVLFFKNNTLYNTTKINGRLNSNTENITFGGGSGLDYYFNGTLDEIIIKNRSLNYTELSNSFGEISVTVGEFKVFSDEITNNSGINRTERIGNFRDYINNYLDSCSFIAGYCNIPINFSSTISNIVLKYNDITVNNIGINIINQTFNKTTYESYLEGFEINISYDYNYYKSITANLIYDGVSYPATKEGNGTNILFKRSITIPRITTGVNKTFYWEILAYNNSNYEFFYSEYKNQTLNNITLIIVNGDKTCPAGFNQSFLLDIKNENNLTHVNATINYNIRYGYSGNNSAFLTYGSINGVNHFSICINESIPSFSFGQNEIFYSGYGSDYGKYFDRVFYFFENTKLTNLTTNISLYLIEFGEGVPFEISVTDNYGLPIKDVYFVLYRWYPSISTYLQSSMGLTNMGGKTSQYIRLQNTVYRPFLYYRNGTLIKIFDRMSFLCFVAPCTKEFILSEFSESSLRLYDISGISQNLVFEPTNSIFTYYWSDASQQTQSINLTVFKQGVKDEKICNAQGIGYAGVISCNVSGYTGKLRAVAYRTASPSIPINELIVTIGNKFINSENGKVMGLFFAILLLIFFVFVGIYSPMAIIVFSIVSLIPLLLLGIINYTVFTGLIILSIIIIYILLRI